MSILERGGSIYLDDLVFVRPGVCGFSWRYFVVSGGMNSCVDT